MKLNKETLKRIIKEELFLVLEKFDQNSFPPQVQKTLKKQIVADEEGKLKQQLLSQMPPLEGDYKDSEGINFGAGGLQNITLTIIAQSGGDSDNIEFSNFYDLNTKNELIFSKDQLGVEDGYYSAIPVIEKFLELKKQGKVPPNLVLSDETQSYYKRMKKHKEREE